MHDLHKTSSRYHEKSLSIGDFNRQSGIVVKIFSVIWHSIDGLNVFDWEDLRSWIFISDFTDCCFGNWQCIHLLNRKFWTYSYFSARSKPDKDMSSNRTRISINASKQGKRNCNHPKRSRWKSTECQRWIRGKPKLWQVHY